MTRQLWTIFKNFFYVDHFVGLYWIFYNLLVFYALFFDPEACEILFPAQDQTHTPCTRRWSLLTTGLLQKYCELLSVFNVVIIWFCCHLLLQFKKSWTIDVLKTFSIKGMGQTVNILGSARLLQLCNFWNYNTKNGHRQNM